MVAAAAVLCLSAVAALIVNDALLRVEKDRTEQRRLAVDNFRTADQERHLAQRLSATLTLDPGLALCERGDVNRGLLWLVPAQETAPSDAVDLDAAARANLAGWRRQLTALTGILRHPREMVLGAFFRRDGKTILTVSRNAADTTIEVQLLGPGLVEVERPLATTRRSLHPDAAVVARAGGRVDQC